jgi:hypothetical protein
MFARALILIEYPNGLDGHALLLAILSVACYEYRQ